MTKNTAGSARATIFWGAAGLALATSLIAVYTIGWFAPLALLLLGVSLAIVAMTLTLRAAKPQASRTRIR